jgi:hypothetical protein
LAKSPIIQNVAGPTLLHPDIHKRNIFVSEEDPSLVTAIIDWQHTSIEPAFVYANETPDFVSDPNAEIAILKTIMAPDDEMSQEESSQETTAAVESPEEEAARKRHEKDILTCRKTFEVVLFGYMKKLHHARTMDQTLLRPILYCDTPWRHGAASIRQELIELSQQWTALGLLGECPYQPTTEELAEHAKQYEDFETVQKLKLFLKRALDADSDGWVLADEWVAAKEEKAKLLGAWMESAKESGTSKDAARDMWPFGEVGASQDDGAEGS